jgi:hypothetical protein
VQISPLVIYRALDNRQDQWEGMVMATYRGFIWVGASYRDGYGLTGIVGFRLKGSYRVSYAYEYPTTEIRDASAGSHEFYLGARLGKRDREEQFAMEDLKKDSLDQVAKAKKELEATQKQEQEKLLAEAKKQEQEKLLAEAKQKEQEKLTEKPEEKTEVKPIEQPVIVVTKPEVKPTQVKENTVDEVPSDYYVVLGAYKSQQNALSQMRALRDQGLMPQMHYRVDKQYYYVYLLKTDNRKQALEEFNQRTRTKSLSGSVVVCGTEAVTS